MRKVLFVAAGIGVAALAAACSGGGGGGGGGTLTSGSYTASNAGYSPDGCNLTSVQPVTGLNGQSITVTVNASSVVIGGETFQGSGSSFQAVVFTTTQAVSGTCNLGINETDNLSVPANDKFHLSGKIDLSQAAGSTDCSALPFTLPCSSTLGFDGTKQ